MKSLLIALSVVGTLVLSLPQVVTAQSTDPVSVINAYIAAMNSGNVDAVSDLFADDAVIVDPAAGGSFSGKDQILAFLKVLVGGKFHLTIVGTPQVTGDRVTSVENYAFSSSSNKHIAEAVVQNGKIKSLTWTPFEESPTATPTAAPTAAPTATLTTAPTALPATGGVPSSDWLWFMGLGGLGLLSVGCVLLRHHSPQV